MFKEILINLLEEYNLTQAEFAIKADIPKTTVSGWLTANRKPDYIALQKLSKFFNVNANYLLELEDEYGNTKNYTTKINIFSNEEQEIINYYNKLDKGQKAEIKGFMRGLLAASGINIENLNKGI